MNDQELKRALSGLRQELDGASPDAPETLDRILASTVVRSRRRARFAKLWIPIAAVLVGSTAWAAGSHHLPAAWSQPDEELRHDEPAADSIAALPEVAIRLHYSVEAAVSTIAPTSAPSAAPVSPAPEPAARAAPTARPPAPPQATATAAIPQNFDALAEDKADFESAYRAHAGGTSNQDAVAAWNRYLERHPRGRFVPEARYARAVALARAGLRREARDALRPFAESQPGSYRRDHALELLEKLAE